MAMGSLLDFLLEHPEQVSIDFHLKLWAAQVAEGEQFRNFSNVCGKIIFL